MTTHNTHNRHISMPLEGIEPAIPVSNKYYICLVGVCSLRYPACKAHAPYYVVCSKSFRIRIVVVVRWVDCVCNSLDMLAHALATHDTICKWLRLLSWL